jgi:hypothetical protein
MIMDSFDQIEPKSTHDHGLRPECLNAKFRHNGTKMDHMAWRAPSGHMAAIGAAGASIEAVKPVLATPVQRCIPG